MREQLQHLLNLSQRPLVTVQVLSFSSGAHTAAVGGFAVLRGPKALDAESSAEIIDRISKEL
ncbi:hypothetical protein GCM10010503_09790 [Streptomyces lucensis JCM 4490]|uniref:DUF5753 domain-containing protein n=2 Tax=Streptomyces lucensis TaxID=67319 RepID=A0A918MM20_9ACTN|nr:hypothetical protein GCM10010503_09790 [Streptomyces lucensis JCM 4490]